MDGYERKLADLFSQAIHDEFTSAIIYLKMGHAIKGVNSVKLTEELLHHGKDEFDHGNMVIEYCAKHGIDADLNYSIDEERIEDAPTEMEEVILETQKLETDAIELYNQIALFAQQNKDLETRKFAQKLMLIEQEHFDDLAVFTNQTRGFIRGSMAAMPVNIDSDDDPDADVIAIPRPY